MPQSTRKRSPAASTSVQLPVTSWAAPKKVSFMANAPFVLDFPAQAAGCRPISRSAAARAEGGRFGQDEGLGKVLGAVVDVHTDIPERIPVVLQHRVVLVAEGA